MDHDAAEVYRSLAPAVLGYLRSQRAPEPEDLLGEVFVQVARDLPRFDGGPDQLRSWVFVIAHHRLLDARRSAGRRPVVADAAVPERAAPDADERLDPALFAALDRLTPEQREVVALRYLADLSVEDVASITGRRPGAVKTLARRGLARLQRDLER